MISQLWLIQARRVTDNYLLWLVQPRRVTGADLISNALYQNVSLMVIEKNKKNKKNLYRAMFVQYLFFTQLQ